MQDPGRRREDSLKTQQRSCNPSASTAKRRQDDIIADENSGKVGVLL
jgi:hypothetical protein